MKRTRDDLINSLPDSSTEAKHVSFYLPNNKPKSIAVTKIGIPDDPKDYLEVKVKNNVFNFWNL